MKDLRTNIRVLLLCSLLLSSAGCSEYWWTRGQPPSSKNLLSRAALQLNDAREQFGAKRLNIADLSQNIETALTEADAAAKSTNNSLLVTQLTSTRDLFMELEGKLSIGSRAPYSELSSQLRSFISQASSGKEINTGALELFSARVLFFMASELSVPAPTFG